MNRSQVPKNWNPKVSFFRRGEAEFFNNVDNTRYDIRWSFEEIKERNLPFSFVLCEMKGFGQTAIGYGEGLLLKTAMTKSFAEAWERLWFFRSIDESGASSPESTNGFAAGASVQHAIEASAAELIERKILIDAWSEQTGWNCLNKIGLIQMIIAQRIKSLGWTIKYFGIKTDFQHSLIAGLGVHNERGITFDSTCVSKAKSMPNALNKLSLSIYRSIKFEDFLKVPKNWEFPESGKPSDHSIFYSKKENKAAFAFLDSSPMVNDQKIALQGLDSIESTVITPPSQFPAVARSHHPYWKKLTWGKSSIFGKNRWPHPLA